jgi:hypothetical protein
MGSRLMDRFSAYGRQLFPDPVMEELPVIHPKNIGYPYVSSHRLFSTTTCYHGIIGLSQAVNETSITSF